MNREELETIIDKCHESGRRVALCFCAHVPQEILEAAGFASVRVFHISDTRSISAKILPGNVCSIVKEVCDLCEDPLMDKVDLIVAETSCDGKKKMYELLSRQEKIYYYQVPQGADREYVHPLIESEIRYFLRMLKERFNLEVSNESIRDACDSSNRERCAIRSVMELQMFVPPKATGKMVYQWLEEARRLSTSKERAEFLEEKVKEYRAAETAFHPGEKRLLITGCPMSGVYQKILESVEENGGAAVCFENCEVMKDAVRSVDLDNEDILSALAECYQNTACAIMSPNTLRFELIQKLVQEYQVDGIIDLALSTCHSYTVEQDKMGRFSRGQLGIPYLPVETDHFSSDEGQINTRIAAFIEML